LQAAQEKVPAIGRYLRRYGIRAQGNGRLEVIRKWQKHFNLLHVWAEQCAWITLAMWDRSPDIRHSLQWFAAPTARNVSDTEILEFTFPAIAREFHPDLDFGWFKQSIHGALEVALERFGNSIGAEDMEERRQPKNLRRA
jgi:hypothetical protein